MSYSESAIITDLKVEVAMLKQEVSFINKLFEKMDILITKMDNQHDTLVDKTTKIESNLSFTKEELSELYNSLEQTEKGISDRITSIEKLLSDEIKSLNRDLSDRIIAQENKTSELLQSKWVLFGGAAVVMWIISNLDFVKHVFIK